MSKTTVRPKLTFKQSIFLLIIATLALFATSGYYWYKKILTDPQRILSSMIDKSLQTSSVQRVISQKNGLSTVDQSVYATFSPNISSQSVTNQKQTSSSGNTKVTTETIGTKDVDYARYNSIEVPGGKKNNIDKVLGVWGKRTGDPNTGQSATFLDDALIAVIVPFGNLNSNERTEVKNEINKVKLYDYSKTQIQYKNGRPVMTYSISLDQRALAQVLSKYVEATNAGSNAELNPDKYEGSEKIQVLLEVDVLTRHLKSINIPSGARLESYQGYNLEKKIDIPQQTISVEELLSRLQPLEQQR